MNIDLTPDLESFLQTQVNSGRYASPNEVVMAALRFLREHGPTMQEPELQPLHPKVDDALASLSRGDGEDGESYIEDSEGRLEESQEDERGS